MLQPCSEKTPASLLLLLALLALCVIPLFPFHTAHAAPRRALTGCSFQNFYDSVYGFPHISNNFYDTQYYGCHNPTLTDDTWFGVSSGGNVPSIVAQGDTWITQQAYPGGTRYGETGRSSQISYPNNGVQYFVQEAYTEIWLAPVYGCNWVNWPQIPKSQDYICGDMQ